MSLTLSPEDEEVLAGRHGPAAAFAMRIVVHMARLSGALTLVDATTAHVDACLFHGEASLAFAEQLVADGARVKIPTTLNVTTLDLLHTRHFRGDEETATGSRRLTDAYVAIGAQPTWTCAPYQLPNRPALGEHIAWAESNAVVFANSVLGARTARYGDFIDIAAAITGRVPLSGFHVPENRRGRLIFDVSSLSGRDLAEDATYALLGRRSSGHSSTGTRQSSRCRATSSKRRLSTVDCPQKSPQELQELSMTPNDRQPCCRSSQAVFKNCQSRQINPGATL